MKRRASYGLWQIESGLVWASVLPLGDGRWQLEAWDMVNENGGDSSLPNHSQAGLATLPGCMVKSGIAQLPRLRGKDLLRALAGWAVRENGAKLDDLVMTWQELEGRAEVARDRMEIFLAHASQQKMDESMAGFANRGLKPTTVLPDYMVLDQLLR